MRELLALGLLRGSPDGELRAVAPEEAVASVVGPLDRDIRIRRALAEQARASIMGFLPVFQSSQFSREKENKFEVLEELTQVRAVIADLAARSRTEILTAQPGGGRAEDSLKEAAPRDRDAIGRGVRLRVLYQHTARFNRGTSAYIDQVIELGAQVRTLDDHFGNFLVFDAETAIISLPANPLGAVVVREPNVVAFIVETYERLWLTADPCVLAPGARAEVAGDVRQAIVRLLAEGMTDASIATRLGMSVRTCRRHIADMMEELGAQSRFQAGYLLASPAQRDPVRTRRGIGRHPRPSGQNRVTVPERERQGEAC
ncbi:helix-turn-helix domain-containing protein [Streptomyces meridianus]|uniref:LuxR C-terminal-related transcriptional regulator n=1 Tax=Streptomyces meridianus TaxID=2938945 RepID=A0ABT0XD89_9ACTN|nr:helix-turn-helix domain-containing protein [Streptomyces meridianus]MCM2580245.1 LuxR C-terminal-related transcriptional regulator [Streptomyces meridianus]